MTHRFTRFVSINKSFYVLAIDMKSTVTVSPKYQIVIPQEVREQMGIKPGQKVTFVEWRGTYALIPVLDVPEAHGFLRSVPEIDQDAIGGEREKDFGEED